MQGHQRARIIRKRNEIDGALPTRFSTALAWLVFAMFWCRAVHAAGNVITATIDLFKSPAHITCSNTVPHPIITILIGPSHVVFLLPHHLLYKHTHTAKPSKQLCAVCHQIGVNYVLPSLPQATSDSENEFVNIIPETVHHQSCVMR